MKKPETTERLLYLIGFVRGALDHVEDECGPQPTFNDGHAVRDTWWLNRKQVIEATRRRIEEEGAAFTYRPPHDHAVRIAGIRSTSTGGWVGALNNWIKAAEKRVAERAGRKEVLS